MINGMFPDVKGLSDNVTKLNNDMIYFLRELEKSTAQNAVLTKALTELTKAIKQLDLKVSNIK